MSHKKHRHHNADERHNRQRQAAGKVTHKWRRLANAFREAKQGSPCFGLLLHKVH